MITLDIIGPPKKDRKRSIKNKNNRCSVFPLIFFSGCRFVRISGYPLISHKLLNKTYIYAHHQNELNAMRGLK